MKIPARDIWFVGVQFALFGLYVFDFWRPFGMANTFKMMGLVIAFLGSLITILAILQLKTSLSPFPTPKENGPLVTNGLFSVVRHPIYTGIFLATLGYGLFIGSYWKLAIAFVLLILFHFKSQYEEQLLRERFKAYASYTRKTGRLFPRIGK